MPCELSLVKPGSANTNEDYSLQFDFTQPSSEVKNSTVEATSSDKQDNSTVEATSSDKQDNSKSSPLMEARLLQLFADARQSGKSQIQVHLHSQPTHAKLHSLHALPALSRSLTKTHPQWVRDLQDGTTDITRGEHFGAHLKRAMLENGKIESTIFAEVLVYCDEIFRVTDLETGALLQGHDDGKFRQVVHGVRLERVATITADQGRTLGNWMITDIDDLLDGNQWFHPSGVGWYRSG
jgi:hypothetical protein